MTHHTPRGYTHQHMKSDKSLTQLKRIRGQLDGIIRMYQDERGCVDIVHQIIAARGSLGRVSRDLLSNEATRCSKEKKVDELDDVLKEVFRY